jgi:hypothetical protein
MRPSRTSQNKARAIAAFRKELRFSLLAERGPYCQYPGCPEAWAEMHEILTRGRGGDPTDPGNILCLCADHHRWVTTHETEARAMGLVRARTAEEHVALFKPWL